MKTGKNEDNQNISGHTFRNIPCLGVYPGTKTLTMGAMLPVVTRGTVIVGTRINKRIPKISGNDNFNVVADCKINNNNNRRRRTRNILTQITLKIEVGHRLLCRNGNGLNFL